MIAQLIAGIALAGLVLVVPVGAQAADNFLARQEFRTYLDSISEDHGLERDRLDELFSGVSPEQQVIDLISRPAEKTLTWADYRPIFLNTQRIEAGQVFVKSHRDILDRAAERYGVPAEIIAAIIGVETYYGRIMGRFPVLESLATLAFDYPKRATFFRRELTEFLLLGDLEGWNHKAIKGSYAGAMGMPQFISSSYREYAVDFDDDGQRDLFVSLADIIGSVAYYLKRHGWIEHAPVAEQWIPENGIDDAMRSLVSSELKPQVQSTRIRELGFSTEHPDLSNADDQRLSVMTFKGKSTEELWVGYNNFYAITRYNHSRLYALAVYQLAQAIKSTS
jgi:membrane-bound lytic murein transglycosylase B